MAGAARPFAYIIFYIDLVTVTYYTSASCGFKLRVTYAKKAQNLLNISIYDERSYLEVSLKEYELISQPF